MMGSISASGNVLYAATYQSLNGILYSIDISDPANASVLDSIPIDGSIWEISAGNGAVAIEKVGGACIIIDTSNPSDLKFAKDLGEPLDTFSVVMVDKMLYRSGYNGFEILDVTSPEAPVHISTTGIPGLWHTQASDKYVVGIDDYYGVNIVSIADPANPVIAGHYQPYAIQRIDVYGDYLYIRFMSHFIIVDISTPSNPIPVGSLGPSYDALEDSIEVDGKYAFFANSNEASVYGTIASIWPQGFPNYVYKFESNWTGDAANDILVHNGYLYLSGYGGLHIYSIY